MENTPSPFAVVTPRRALRYILLAGTIVIILLVAIVAFVTIYSEPPETFPVATPITIPLGSTVSEVVSTLADADVVASPLLFYIVLLTLYEPTDVKASTYVFDQPYNVFAVAKKVVTGDFTSNLVRLTHREGERVNVLAETVHEALPNISVEEFIAVATPEEGYLFPETYFLPPHFTANDVVATLKASYEEFIRPYRGAIAAGSLTEAEVVILASIVEREANDDESMGMVSSILQNRLAIGMALQADASIEYILNKPLKELTPEDLKVDSPYNTYSHNGLPPTPIGNPGPVALKAVIEPTPSDYLFYITDETGTFHYATTYEDHKRNIARYLK